MEPYLLQLFAKFKEQRRAHVEHAVLKGHGRVIVPLREDPYFLNDPVNGGYPDLLPPELGFVAVGAFIGAPAACHDRNGHVPDKPFGKEAVIKNRKLIHVAEGTRRVDNSPFLPLFIKEGVGGGYPNSCPLHIPQI